MTSETRPDLPEATQPEIRNAPDPLWRRVHGSVLLAILAAYVLWMLSLPCFPTTDGPVHMYYAHILGSLLQHRDPTYAHFFRIRHLLPPYALYYYALIGLEKLVPMFLADRLIICVYFTSFVFGFRYLAGKIGPSADYATLLATLLLVNWPLGMGFVNFCLALSGAFWALGLWLRVIGKKGLWGRVAFLLLVSAVMFTHPVSLLLLLAVSGTVLLVRIVHARRVSAGKQLPPYWVADTVTWCIAALHVGYVKLFANANPLQQDQGPSYFWLGVIGRFRDYGLQRSLAVVNGARWDFYTYRLGLALILILPFVLAVQQRLRNLRLRVWTVGDTFLLLGTVLLLGLPFFPAHLNGLSYFADRLILCIWIAFLLAASGWSLQSRADLPVLAAKNGVQARTPAFSGISARHLSLACIVFALLTNFALLHSADSLVRPAARLIAHLEDEVPVPPHALALATDDGRKRIVQSLTLSWDPFYWAGVHVLRKQEDIMANAPWMDESIIPITDTENLPQVALPVLATPSADKLEAALLRAPQQLTATLQTVHILVMDHEGRTPLPLNGEPLLRAAEAGGAQWHCVPAGAEDFRVCLKLP